ncbi:MAG TPA: nicotinate-nucleotide adenylyltransferase [Dehalococcoidia bacterium]|nr:nicotinate-nucleotide adenylyltransferase [Dehalococcoidia bacterium]
MRIGVLGGTFDPIHIGHLILAEQAREQVALDRVLFIPAGDPWRKAGRDIAPAQHRLAMTKLAIEGVDEFAVDDCEVRREGPTYTVDTLRELRARIDEDDELFFILGEDALADLPHWHNPSQIADYACIVVAPREGADAPESLPFDPVSIVRIEMPYIALTASDLRQRVRLGRSLRFMVPVAVERYIEEQGLYV